MTLSDSLWQWQDWQGLPYLTCQLLQNWQHGFFTQNFYPRTPESLVEVLQSDATVFRVKQVHGDRILTPTEIHHLMNQGETDEIFPPADAVMTELEDQAIWVASADCTPVLIGDLVTGRVAAIHAGWRGTAQSIVPKTIERFLALGSQLPDLRIALGPAIAGEVYQVNLEVASEVGASVLLNCSATEILSQLSQLAKPPFLPDSEPEKIRLDVRRINELQLENLGI
ncbi:MAG: peptidoglycan editing factor PgeF, partial [Microcystaceae cyanobacterium]